MNRFVGWIIGGVMALVVLAIVTFSTTYVVDQSERGVRLYNGAVVDVVPAGRYYKWPIVEDVKFISLQTMTYEYKGIEAYSYDNQPANLVVSITLAPTPEDIDELYGNFKTVEAAVARLVTPKIQTETKNVFGKYTAVSAIQKRQQFEKEVSEAVRESLKGQPLTMYSLQVQEIGFSDAFDKSVELRMQAEVQVQTQRQVLERGKVQAELKVVEARAAADSALETARGQSQSILLVGEAEAKAIRLRAEALAANTNLVNLNAVEKWNGVLPTSMVPGSAVPFLNLK